MTSKATGDKKKRRNSDKLDSRQLKATYLITAGFPLSQIAEQLNVCRQTLSEWKNHHPLFRAKLEELDAERDEEVRYALSATHTVMLSELRKLMQEGPHADRLKAIQYCHDQVLRSNEDSDRSSPLLGSSNEMLRRVLGKYTAREGA
ncbi:hypothetical protein [Lysobacter terrae]